MLFVYNFDFYFNKILILMYRYREFIATEIEQSNSVSVKNFD